MIKLREEIEGGRKPEFQIRHDGVTVRGSRMCVPKIGELKREIMEEAHSSTYVMHPGRVKMKKLRLCLMNHHNQREKSGSSQLK